MNRGGFSWNRLLGISQAKVQTLQKNRHPLNQIRAPEKIRCDVRVFGSGNGMMVVVGILVWVR
jgi:hypothetical protein